MLNETEGPFFSGDAIYDGNLTDDLPGCDREDYRATMVRLKAIEVNIVHGATACP